jgi:hypothetical protein
MSETKFKTIVQVSSNTYNNCRLCPFQTPHLGDIPVMVNHYLQSHGLELMHVGQETSHADDGSPWHSTVAVLGSVKSIAAKAPGRLALPEKDPE